MNTHLYPIGCLLLLGTVAHAHPEVPGRDQPHPIALSGATIHRVDGPPLKDGVILFEKGVITAIGDRVVAPRGTRIIDITGRHVYPGLFESRSNIGLVEVNAVRATRDFAETGRINPNVKSWVSVNPDSELIPVTRSNGVLLSVSAPTGGLIAGQSAVMQLDGWTYEDMTLRAGVGMHLDWPTMSPASDWWIEEAAEEQMKERDEALRRLRDTFDLVRAYRKAREANGDKQAIDARWESMLPVLAGKQPLIVDADEIQEIQAAVAFAEQQGVRLVIFGGYDAPHCAELLKKHDVPVIIAGVYRLPRRRSDDYDAAYTLPKRLSDAGVKFCISGAGRFGASMVRNLPYHAATAAAYGLPRSEALKAITLYPAEILGVADRVGSLTVGKHATLIVTDGDPLETPTQVTSAYIQGRKVDLNDRHKRLWRKYQQKYRRLGLGGE